ncbi:MAG: HNH endonuclease [Sphingorhabdus sp.]
MAKWPYNTTNWRKLRALKLSVEPLCEHCAEIDRLVMATVVDHVDPISAGGAPFPSLDKLNSLCVPCHSRKTARGTEAGAIRTTKPRKGCKADGSPLHSDHPWHGARQ